MQVVLVLFISFFFLSIVLTTAHLSYKNWVNGGACVASVGMCPRDGRVPWGLELKLKTRVLNE
jgi:hypothetical protein